MKTSLTDFTWKMGGPAGSGIKNSALILAKALHQAGYYVHANIEYPSRVRGGNNILEVRVASVPIYALREQTDLLVALDDLALVMWSGELVKGANILLDRENSQEISLLNKLKRRGLRILDVPSQRLLTHEKLPVIMRNTIMLGATQALLGVELAVLKQNIKRAYQYKKSKQITGDNLRAAQLGYDYVRRHYPDKLIMPRPKKSSEHIFLEGSDAVIMGALKAGMRGYIGYPMTPTSVLLRESARLQKQYNLFVYQPEDEIAAAQYSLGLWHAGARALTATSGGGFALMSESLGLAAMTETPMVVLLGQRPGPSTGLPTRTGQGDLRFALHAGQDEPARVVLAPGDPTEAFELTFHAFNIAERYQLLVIILADKYLLESAWTVPMLVQAGLKIERGKIVSLSQARRQKNYQRHAITKDGVSPRVLPGTPYPGVVWRTSSDEHNESGFIDDSIVTREQMVAKRQRKLDSAYRGLLKVITPVAVFGDRQAKRAIISLGSNKGVLMDLLARLPKRQRVKVVMVRCLAPFPQRELLRALKGIKKITVVENNAAGLLEGLIKEHTGIEASAHYRQVNGRPISLEQMIKNLKL